MRYKAENATLWVQHGRESLESLEAIFRSDISPQQVAAIIYEQVQDESSFYVAPPEFVTALRVLCEIAMIFC